LVLEGYLPLPAKIPIAVAITHIRPTKKISAGKPRTAPVPAT
jgi:hypothetical protein